MYLFVTCVLYFTIVGLIAVCGFALRKWKSRLHTYLFFSCVANLIYDTGCLMELRAADQQTYVTALKMGYLGRIWIGFSLFIFIAELCSIKLPNLLKTVAALIHVIIYGTIINLEHNTLYYNYMEFTMDGDFPKLLHTGGPLYYVLTALNLIYTFGGIYMITRHAVREKNRIARKRYMTMMVGIFAVGGAYIIYFFKLVPLARKFDVMVIGFAVCLVTMFVAIIKYRMLDATAAAKNYVVDELSEAIIVADTDDKITYFNKPAQKIFPELNNDMTEEITEKLLKELREATESGDPIRIMGNIYTPKANSFSEDGTEAGTLFTLTDDSEHYRYMDELRRQKKIADDANMAKTQFLANMSHEIRTPINAVLGFNEMIMRECAGGGRKDKDKAPDPKRAFSNISSYAGNIQNAGNNLLSIINDILDISKIEEGKMDIVEAPYTLSSLLNDVRNMMLFRAEEKGLDFTVDADSSLPDELYGDKSRVRQVITNLLTNAVKYTDKGSVHMTVRGRADGGMEAGRMLNLIVEVRDTGIGMHAEDIDRLFDKFQRFDLTHNSTVEGSGLGLAISKQLMDMMGGRIEVQSVYGSGSTFIMELPQKIISCDPIGDFMAGVESDDTAEKSNEKTFTAPEAHILIVDDTRVNLIVARGLLKNTKIRIDTAGSGSESIMLANENSYDLILMDQRMPGMDGTEALKIIRNGESSLNRETPIICLTADAIIGAKEHYMAEGFTDYLAKPINSHELEKMMLKYLPEDKVITQ